MAQSMGCFECYIKDVSFNAHELSREIITWSEEAFEVARRDNKPVFLSIGYS